MSERVVKRQKKGARVIAIDDRAFIAACEGCDKSILDGDTYAAHEDGVYTCRDCT